MKKGINVKNVRKKTAKSVMNQLRDLERLLKVKKDLTPLVKQQLMEQINELKTKQTEKKQEEKMKKIKQRYKKVKFVG
jgi:hypothetical protein